MNRAKIISSPRWRPFSDGWILIWEWASMQTNSFTFWINSDVAPLARNQFAIRGTNEKKKKKCGKRWERDADRVTERSDFPYSWTMWAEEQKETKYAGRWQRGNRRGRGLVRKYFSNTIAAAAFYACAEFLIELRIDDIQIYGLTKNSERGGRNSLFIPAASASRFKAFFNRKIKYKGF